MKKCILCEEEDFSEWNEREKFVFFTDERFACEYCVDKLANGIGDRLLK